MIGISFNLDVLRPSKGILRSQSKVPAFILCAGSKVARPRGTEPFGYMFLVRVRTLTLLCSLYGSLLRVEYTSLSIDSSGGLSSGVDSAVELFA